MNIKWLSFKSKIKGLISSVDYYPLLESGDSSPYFGTYEGQRYGIWETSCCWDFSACEVAETRLEMLWKLGKIPTETREWLTKNGYIDKDGDFYLSRRWVAIITGVRNAGNDPKNFWEMASVAGLIPNSMLPYDPKEAQKWITQDQFNNDYFNPNVITMEMELMGQEFLKRFTIRAENIWAGTYDKVSPIVQTYLKEGSIQIALPVPQDGSWNKENVEVPIGRYGAEHAVELYKFDSTSDYPYFIYDSYEPHLKQLNKNYYIPLITRVTIIPKNIPNLSTVKKTKWEMMWYNIYAWLKGKPLPYPNSIIG